MADTPSKDQMLIWYVRDTPFSEWRILPGIYTATDIWKLRKSGRIADATPARNLPKDGGADSLRKRPEKLLHSSRVAGACA